MNRRSRRRLYVLGVAVFGGLTAPLWAPPLLSRVELFRVEETSVAGNRYVSEAEIRERASIHPGASVWDDPTPWERAVGEHPLIRGARVSRAGVDRLRIRVREVQPVALVSTPELVPVDAGGRILPLDPAEHGLDLPILDVPATDGSGGRLRGPAARTLLELLDRLRRSEPDFVGQTSELGLTGEGAVRVHMTDAEPCALLLLPVDAALPALRRVEMALGHQRRPVETADARFEGQVVLRLREGS